MNVPFKQLEDLDLSDDFSIAICGSRRSGKSVLILHLLHYLLN